MLEVIKYKNGWITVDVVKQSHFSRNFGYAIQDGRYVGNQRHFTSSEGFKLESTDNVTIEVDVRRNVFRVLRDKNELRTQQPCYIRNNTHGKLYIKKLKKAVREYNRGKFPNKKSVNIQLKIRYLV